MPDPKNPQDDLGPNGGLLDGRETEWERRTYNARHGLADDAEGSGLDHDPEEIFEAPAEQAVPHPTEPEEERREGVVVSTIAEALLWWARWHRDEGDGPLRLLPRGLDRPGAPYGSPVAHQVAALVEATPGFLLFEKRLRIVADLQPARDALPASYVATLPSPFAFLAWPVFTAGIAARLPMEFFPPEVVGSKDLLPWQRASLGRIEAKYRGRYPSSGR